LSVIVQYLLSSNFGEVRAISEASTLPPQRFLYAAKYTLNVSMFAAIAGIGTIKPRYACGVPEIGITSNSLAVRVEASGVK
jgi:hypothetical protein